MILGTSQPVISALGIITYSLMKTLFPKQLLHLLLENVNILKVPFGLAQAPAYFQELMNKVLKDLLFTSAYLVTLLSTAKWQKNT